jgi:RNA recognition motif-containing protein
MANLQMPRIGSSVIQISPFLKGAEKLAYDAQELSKKVYVGNLPLDTHQEELFDYFELWGRVKTCYIPEEKRGALFKYGFVTFFNSEDAQNLKRIGSANFKNTSITFKEFSYGNKLKIQADRQRQQHQEPPKVIFIDALKQSLKQERHIQNVGYSCPISPQIQNYKRPGMVPVAKLDRILKQKNSFPTDYQDNQQNNLFNFISVGNSPQISPRMESPRMNVQTNHY